VGEWSTYIAVHMRNVDVRWVSVVIAHAPASLLPEQIPGTLCTGGWMGPRTGLDECGEKSYAIGVRSPKPLIREKSLYRLPCPRVVSMRETTSYYLNRQLL
jgi:hypothetical protein